MNAIAMLRNARRAALAAGLAATAIPHATAATAAATFQVTANVQTQCNVSAVDLAFGTVDAAARWRPAAKTATSGFARDDLTARRRISPSIHLVQ